MKSSLLSQAQQTFDGTGIQVVTSFPFLGGIIGDTDGQNSFVSRKVQEWSNYIELLYSVANSQPQATYIDLTRFLQHEWTFLQRITPSCGLFFDKLDHVLTSQFLPDLFGQDSTSIERLLYSLPTHMGGLNFKLAIPFMILHLLYLIKSPENP